MAGANETGFHLRHVTAGRDYQPDQVGRFALAPAGAACADCGAPLRHARGVEVGNIFQLGTRYTEAAGATFLDETGRERPVVMGSYGIGVGRLLACLAEEHRDEHGLVWPADMAPLDVQLVALARKPEAREAAEQAAVSLRAAGLTVLVDDRKKVSPGFKFAEADLRGLPLRVVVSDRGVRDGLAELRRRHDGHTETVPLDALAEMAARWLHALRGSTARPS